ncbi:tryptophan 7-halogenase [Myxococcota bacterium]|nr:tryptophan 7-halogenase [Myxococcota bacterium]
MKTDVVIVGGAPGGISMALFLQQLGVKATVVEKDEFPRYHIGESMTGEAGNIVRALGLEKEMMAAAHPWKQGVKVWGPGGKNDWFVPVMGRGPNNELIPNGTWQVRRSDFDKMLHDAARARGIDIVHGEALSPIRGDDGSVKGCTVKMADGGVQEIHSEVLVDASGQYTWLARQGVTSKRIAGHYDKQIAIFSQVKNTIRDNGNDTTDREHHPDNTLIFYKQKHHWAWFIPLDAETVSVGIVSPGSYYASKNESKADFVRRELAELNAELDRRVPDKTLFEEARAVPNYSFQMKEFAGKGWLCIGDSHRFIDPIFSFGIYVSMREAQLAAPVIRDYLAGKNRDSENPFKEHMELCERGLDKVQDLMDAFWEKPLGFAYLVHGGRHFGDIIDLFAGRIHSEGVSPGLAELRMLAAKGRQNMAGSAEEFAQMEQVQFR